jgi:hypothetical protein
MKVNDFDHSMWINILDKIKKLSISIEFVKYFNKVVLKNDVKLQNGTIYMNEF